jgi:hypothetical protein
MEAILDFGDDERGEDDVNEQNSGNTVFLPLIPKLEALKADIGPRWEPTLRRVGKTAVSADRIKLRCHFWVGRTAPPLLQEFLLTRGLLRQVGSSGAGGGRAVGGGDNRPKLLDHEDEPGQS